MPSISSGGLANFVPLPGVGEMESAVKSLIAAMKATGYENDQCESLAQRLDSLIAVADTCNDHKDFAEMLK
ncbi:hypothetical protein BDV93DRAFT_557897 [Ceratobasidium sp. AG-I]|nr:hypothetical protein BDV93DRAFT_557897 [Ceratobasidium sp. AG-I]